MWDLKKYRHVIWDFNGTLLDDLDIGIAIEEILMQRYGLTPLSKQEYLDSFDFPIRDWYARIGYDVSRYEALAEEWSQLYASFEPTCTLNAGVQELLSYFASSQIGQSILSAADERTISPTLVRLGIADYFTHIFALNSNLAQSKLERGLALRETLGFTLQNSHELVLIGDTTHDAQAAQTIGCDCILAACGHQSKEKLLRCASDHVFVAEDLCALLSSL